MPPISSKNRREQADRHGGNEHQKRQLAGVVNDCLHLRKCGYDGRARYCLQHADGECLVSEELLPVGV